MDFPSPDSRRDSRSPSDHQVVDSDSGDETAYSWITHTPIPNGFDSSSLYLSSSDSVYSSEENDTDRSLPTYARHDSGRLADSNMMSMVHRNETRRRHNDRQWGQRGDITASSLYDLQNDLTVGDFAMTASSAGAFWDSRSTKHRAIADSLSEILKCPVCYELILPPVKQCASGHIVCDECFPLLDSCPVCRSSIKGDFRNRPLEHVINAIPVLFPCRYAPPVGYGNQRGTGTGMMERSFYSSNNNNNNNNNHNNHNNHNNDDWCARHEQNTNNAVQLHSSNRNNDRRNNRMHAGSPRWRRHGGHAVSKLQMQRKELGGCCKLLPWQSKRIHEMYCRFRPYKCPCGDFNCKWAGPVSQMSDHIVRSHASMASLRGNDVVFMASDVDLPGRVVNWVMTQSCFGRLFVISIRRTRWSPLQTTADSNSTTVSTGNQIDLSIFTVFVQLIGNDVEAKRFYYKVELSNADLKNSSEKNINKKTKYGRDRQTSSPRRPHSSSSIADRCDGVACKLPSGCNRLVWKSRPCSVLTDIDSCISLLSQLATESETPDVSHDSLDSRRREEVVLASCLSVHGTVIKGFVDGRHLPLNIVISDKPFAA